MQRKRAAGGVRARGLESKPPQVVGDRLPLRNPVSTLTSTSQVTPQTLIRVPVQFAKRLAGVAVSEVRTPTPQPAAHLANHLVDGHEASPMARQLPQLRSGSRHRFLRREHVQVTPRPSESV